MLAPMSAILNDYCELQHASAISIVLRGLHALCEAEVKHMFFDTFYQFVTYHSIVKLTFK